MTTVPPEVLLHRAELATLILDKAVECKGLAFGGFVRDWVVRQQPFKGLDIWFTECAHADQFVKALACDRKNVLTRNPILGDVTSEITDKPLTHFEPEINRLNYPFDRMRVMVLNGRFGEPNHVFVDIIVSPLFPVNDFTANLLCYNGNNIVSGVSTIDVAGLIRDVRHGRTTLLPPYFIKVEAKDLIACKRTQDLQRKGFVIENLPTNFQP